MCSRSHPFGAQPSGGRSPRRSARGPWAGQVIKSSERVIKCPEQVITSRRNR
jgi:hypothetical protein